MADEIVYYAGDSKTIRFNFIGSDGGPLVIDPDISVLTLSIKFRDTYDDLVLQKASNVAEEGAVIDGPQGVVEFYFLSADTVNLRPLRMIYDVRMVTGSDILTLLKSVFDLQLPVNR